MKDKTAKYEEENKKQVVSERDDFSIERYEQFFKFLPPNCDKVLDVGCNMGKGGERIYELNSDMEIHGLDCVKDRLDNLPPAYKKSIYGLTNEIPSEDCQYDAVLAGEFVEHLYPQDVDVSLCEMQRVLKVGGKLLLTTPNPHYLKNKLYKLTVYSQSHQTQHYPKLLKMRLYMHGFSKVKVYGSGRVSRYLGYYFPYKSVYGSYLITAVKF